MKQKKKKNNIVLAFGTFDIIHPGHLYYLSQSKKQGTRLVVVIARDETVGRRKGRKPIFCENDRRTLIASLAVVDEAVLGDPIHHCRVIDRIRPDTICLGYDQNITRQHISLQLKHMNIPVRSIVRIRSYKPRSYKSSLYKKKLSIGEGQ